MAYGSIKVDTIVFTNNSADQSVSISGIIASTSGNLTVTGTISGSTVQATYGTFTNLTGVTTTGTTANFVTVSGTTVTGTTAQFTSITGGTAGFTTVTGTTVTGTTANFVTVSGTTVTGTTASFTSGVFTNISGTTATFTSGIIASGTFALPSLAILSDPDTGIFSPGADQLAISTNGVERVKFGTTATEVVFNDTGVNYDFRIEGDTNANLLFVDASADCVGIGTSSVSELLQVSKTGGANIQVDSGSSNVVAKFGASAVGAFVGSTSNDYFQIYSNNTARIHVTAAGLVGIGTSPSSLLHLSGSVCFLVLNATTANSNNIMFQISGSTKAYIGLAGNLGGSDNDLGFRAESGNNQVFYIGAAEKARIDSSGRLLVGTSTARGNFYNSTNSPFIQLEGNDNDKSALAIIQDFNSNTQGAQLILAKNNSQTINTNVLVALDDRLGTVSFQGNDNSQFVEAASIQALVDGTPGANDMPGRLVFSTTSDSASSPTPRMTIDSAGNVLIGKTVTTFATAGVRVLNDGRAQFTNSGSELLSLNRLTNDGNLIDFYQDSALEGNINVSGSTVALSGAHLSRWSQLASGAERIEILRGSVLSNIDEMCEWGEEENEQLNRMKVSTVEGDKNVSGVFQAWDDDDDTYTNDFYCAMTGDFIIRIAEGVTIERGDLLMSAGDGTAKTQDDDIIRSKTIAKVTSTNVSCTYDDGSYCVPCVLMAC